MSALSKTAARKRSSGEKARSVAARATSPSVGSSGTASGAAKRPADNCRGGPPDGRAGAIPATATHGIDAPIYQTKYARCRRKPMESEEMPEETAEVVVTPAAGVEEAGALAPPLDAEALIA